MCDSLSRLKPLRNSVFLTPPPLPLLPWRPMNATGMEFSPQRPRDGALSPQLGW